MDTPVIDETSPAPPPDPSGPATSPGAPAPVPPAGDWFRSWFRAGDDRLLGGVCGGLAARFGVPTLVVRCAAVLLAFTGIGVPLYVLAWVLLPTDRGTRMLGHGPARDLVAIGAVAIAGLVVVSNATGLVSPEAAVRMFPWLVILAGLALLLRRHDVGASAGPTGVPAATPPAPSAWSGPSVMPRAAQVPRPKPVVGPLTWCAALLAVGLMGLAQLGGIEWFTPGVMAAVVLAMFGLGLSVSAWFGRARGLMLPAAAMVLLMGGLAIFDVRATTTAGPFDLTVTRGSALPTTLESAIGSNTLDLSDLRLDRDRTLVVDQTLGDLLILLPRTARTTTVVDIGTGSVSVDRPSVRSSLYDPSLAQRWVTDGLPTAGAPLTDDEADAFRGAPYSTIARSYARTGPLRTGDDSGPRLDLRVALGIGTVRVVDLRWADVPDSISTPEPLCTATGAPAGTVEACSAVAEGQRLPLCINDNGFLVDCTTDRSATTDNPRIAACRDFLGQQTDCAMLGIPSPGAELISPSEPAPAEALPTEPPATAPADVPADASPGAIPVPVPTPVDPSSPGA